MAEIHTLEEICSQTNDILQVVTKDLPIPAQDKVRDVRKMISVFTYSVIKELSIDQSVHEDDIYLRYLMGGGLNSQQANVIVNRTRDEFTQREFGEECIQLAKEVVKQWHVGERDIQSYLHRLFA